LKKYSVIYADPPWRYDFSNTKNRKIENHYGTMSIEDICNIKIETERDCVLYLWATAPKLLEALSVIKAWGFEYKTQMIWDKEIIGMGYWFRGQHEILIVATKGNISPPEQGKRISSIYKEKRTRHSKKPDKIREYISEWFRDVNKIELFAREKTEGWDVWGNEVESDIDLLSIAAQEVRP